MAMYDIFAIFATSSPTLCAVAIPHLPFVCMCVCKKHDAKIWNLYKYAIIMIANITFVSR